LNQRNLCGGARGLQRKIKHVGRTTAGIVRDGFPVLARFRPYLPTAALAFLIFYFGFHALTGDRGLLRSNQRSAALAAKTHELAQLRAQRLDLERRARLMRDASLSADLLEERARSLLGYSDPRDYVIRTHQ
jgi:cell division protein FtsB